MSELCLCYGCMNQYNKEYTACPHCGFNPAEVQLEPYQLKPGTMLQKRYIVGKMLGSGSFSVTYMGFDMTRQMKVVVKEYLPSDYATRVANRPMVTVTQKSDEEDHYIKGLDSFVQEGRKVALLEHMDGAAQVLDVFMENNTAYIVVEYVEGQLLSARLKKEGKIDPDRTVRLLLPVLDALNQVHGKGVLHKDISPDHLIWTADDKLRLIEFGFARSTPRSRSRSQTVIIKPGYTPAEQYADTTGIGTWTDVYSIAAVAYKMMTGVTPPDGMKRRTKECMVSPANMGVRIPSYMESAIEKAMNVDVRQRTQTIAEFRHQLNTPSSAEPQRQHTPSVLPPADRTGADRAKQMPHFAAASSVAAAGQPGRLHIPKWAWIAVIAVLTLILVLGLVIALRPGNALNPMKFVPSKDVEGKALAEVREMPKYANLKVFCSKESNEVEVDKVAEIVKATFGDEQGLVLSAGPEYSTLKRVAVPRIIGLTEEDAKQQLKENGFENITVKEDRIAESVFAEGCVDKFEIWQSEKKKADNNRKETMNPAETSIVLYISGNTNTGNPGESVGEDFFPLKSENNKYNQNLDNFTKNESAKKYPIKVRYESDTDVEDGRIIGFGASGEDGFDNTTGEDGTLTVVVVENELKCMPYLKGTKWEDWKAAEENNKGAKTILRECGLISGEDDSRVVFKYIDDPDLSDADKKTAECYHEDLIYKTEPEYYKSVAAVSTPITLYINQKKPPQPQQSTQTVESENEQTQPEEISDTESVPDDMPSQQVSKTASGNASARPVNTAASANIQNQQQTQQQQIQTNPGSSKSAASTGHSSKPSAQSTSKPTQSSQQPSKPAQETSQGQKEAVLTSIEITKQPAKKYYTMNDELDTNGLIVVAHYSDNSKTTLNKKTSENNNGYDLLGFDSLSVGEKEVTVTYQGKESHFKVNVMYYCQGKCGDNATYRLNADGVLSITGTGTMEDYSNSIAPWSDNREFIKEVKISGVTSIGGAAFDQCSNLTKVTMDNKVTSIGESAFHNCSSVTAMEIPDSVTTIGLQAFARCTSLKNVTIPDRVTSIGSYAFYDCTSLTSITIPDSVTSIEFSAFSHCTSLTSITVKGRTKIPSEWEDAVWKYGCDAEVIFAA